MKLYIYETNNFNVVSVIESNIEEDCLEYAESNYDSEFYGWTFTPAFGSIDGLVCSDSVELINL